jgi:hypothetical protein
MQQVLPHHEVGVFAAQHCSNQDWDVFAFGRLSYRLSDRSIFKRSWLGDPGSRLQTLMGESSISGDFGLSLNIRASWRMAGSKWVRRVRPRRVRSQNHNVDQMVDLEQKDECVCSELQDSGDLDVWLRIGIGRWEERNRSGRWKGYGPKQWSGWLLGKEMVISQGMSADGKEKVKTGHEREVYRELIHGRSRRQWERVVQTTDTEQKNRIPILRGSKSKFERNIVNVESGSELWKVERMSLVV